MMAADEFPLLTLHPPTLQNCDDDLLLIIIIIYVKTKFLATETQHLCLRAHRLLLGSQKGASSSIKPPPPLSLLSSTHSESEPVTKAPSLRLHTPGCIHALGLQALRATSEFKAHFALVSAQCRASLCRNPQIYGHFIKYTAAYILWDQPATDTL